MITQEHYDDLVATYYFERVDDWETISDCNCILMHASDVDKERITNILVERNLIYSFKEMQGGSGEYMYPMTKDKYYEVKINDT